ncbi:hypothetical protein P171DRAFT_481416 [Karstenula rhodostoma CBS 690.94]|uniref:Secreted protein n=1 Tax=Karstenula rhodostoma CBS 690.94 TaxID=1392251 RepID=A0A9P4UFB6_9PLEO|nr:hypothetical protein P171DRAFT_481416 [Karstenula rhodostoma CBS 690.94]
MHLSFLLAAGITSLAALPVPAQENCWSSTQITCRNAFAKKDAAHTAITKACEAMSTCTPGTTPSPATVTGKVPGYTATLRVGNKCAGVNPWSKGACVALFGGTLYPQCKTNESLPYPDYPPNPWPPVPPVDFPLASMLSTCDDSWLSFNLGG